MTNLPAVVVQANGAIVELFGAYGIECTADGLLKMCLSCAAGFLKRTETAVMDGFTGVEVLDVVIIGEDAVAAVDNAGHQLTVRVGIGDALSVDDRLRRCRQIRPYGIEAVFNFADFIEKKRCSSVTLHTAFTLACGQVATELFRQDVRRNQHAANLEYGGNFFHFEL